MSGTYATSAKGYVILTGTSHPDLANKIVARLATALGKASVYQKANKETIVEIEESVRGKDVFIIQTGTGKDPNNNIMELLILCYACKTASARRIIGVIPYLPYCKQSKMRKRGSIVCKLLAQMSVRAGMTHIITMDLHQKEIQGFFNIPVDNLRASPFFIQYIQEQIPDWRNAVIVARTPSAAKRATSYAERIRLGIAVIHGENKESEADEQDGRHSPPPFNDTEGAVAPLRTSNLGPESSCPNFEAIHSTVPNGVDTQSAAVSAPTAAQPTRTPRTSMGKGSLSKKKSNCTDVANIVDLCTASTSGTASASQSRSEPLRRATIEPGFLDPFPMLVAKEKPPINVVGDVGGKIAIIIDDIIDDVGSFIEAAEILKERGAYKVYVMATHGLLSADAPMRLEDSPIDVVVVTNTVPHEVQKMQCHKIKTVEIDVMLSESMRRIYHGESMSYLFRNISTDD